MHLSTSTFSLIVVLFSVLFVSINCEYVTMYPYLQNISRNSSQNWPHNSPQNSPQNWPHNSPQNWPQNSAGICNIEVPIMDILSPDQRHGPIPQGNGSRPGYTKIQICCSGWKVKPASIFSCEPICDRCENGICTAPNVCTCHPNYIKGPNGQCISSQNQYNYQNRCPTGYTMNHQSACIPDCPNGCGIGGRCVSPGVCQCDHGFEKTPMGTCQYHCDGGCTGGDCIGPNQCRCRTGSTPINGVCSGSCPRGCLNGRCVGQDKCECPSYLHLDVTGTKCILGGTPSGQGHCSQPCLNGDCTGPETCTCKPGYTKDMSYPAGNRCVAHCPGGCENGQCSSPNFCICNVGFVKEYQGSNKCVRRYG